MYVCVLLHCCVLPSLDSRKLRSVQAGTHLGHFQEEVSGTGWDWMRCAASILYTTLLSYVCLSCCFLSLVIPPCTFEQSGSVVRNTTCKLYIMATTLQLCFLTWTNRCLTCRAANKNRQGILFSLVYYLMLHFLMAKPYNCGCDKNKVTTHFRSPQHPDNQC